MAQFNSLIVTGGARFLNTIKGTIENSEKVGGHSTPASGNASSDQVVLGNDTRLTNSRTPTSHTHGNIQNGGTLQTNDITIASGDKIVVTDSSDSAKVARTSISFDGSTATKALTQKGTWETFGTSNLTLGTTATTALKGDTKYAGSSSAGGSATSAVKLDTATAGSATQPCYFADGVPSACTYSLNKTVPADAVFTDTNTTYTFAGGTNKFTVTPSGGTAQDITITPSITNNITGSGTTNYVPKFTGTNTIGNGWGTTTSVTSGSGSLVTSGGVWSALASRTVMRDPFVASGTSYSVDNVRGATRFVYTTHGAPNTGTIVAFDSSDNTNYTLQLLGGYSTDRLFFRTRYGDKSTWNDWNEATPRHQFATIQGGSSATYYIPMGMRGTNGSESQYLLSCPQANGGGGLFLLCPDTYSTQKMIITTLKTFSGTVSQTTDPWGFIIRTGGSATVPSIIRL
jgi:hypothetical protein